jgi:hypothetical protein
VSLFATEKLPQPVVITGVVDRDLPSRSLSVRPSELSSGYEKLNWRTAHQALVQAQETGWRSGGTVYASAPGAFQVAHVLPGPYLSLEVHFPSGVEAFSQLVRKPGLFAFVSVDRSTGTFIGVKFRNWQMG